MPYFVTVIDSATLEETAPGVTAAFPYRSVVYDLLGEQGRLCPWHWHNEVELFYMPRGALSYHLPGYSCDFYEGDVGFINANVLHMTTPLGPPPCQQQEAIFLPRLVSGVHGSAIEVNYVTPLLKNAAADLIRVPADDPEAPRLRELMDQAQSAYEEQAFGYELRVRNCMSELWLRVAKRAPAFTAVPTGGDASRIKAMLRFIDDHFAEPLTLREIAASAQIGPREASRCFRRQLSLTAFEYLQNLRLDRACEYLRGGSLPITEIALRCGFSSASYFSKVFREHMNATPKGYRRAQAAQ